MKNLLYISLLTLSGLTYAQNSALNEYDEDFADLLVQVAMQNNPNADIAEHTVNAAEYDVKLSSLEWLNAIQFTGNINEFNIDPERDVYNRSQFLPRYNLGARVTLGMFFTIPVQTKRSKEELMIAHSMEQSQELTLSAQVKRQYHNYIMQRKIFKLQEEELMNMENNFKLSEERFTRGEITFEEYAAARSAQNVNKATYYRAEAALRDARVNLEEVIGVPLEEVY